MMAEQSNICFGFELCNETFDTLANFIADGSDRIYALASGVVQLPVKVSLSREEGANIATTHRDDNIAELNRLSGQNLGLLTVQVDTFFKHGFDDIRVDGVDWGGARRADFNIVTGKVIEIPRSHLGPAGIMNADE
jgi:hypothetical protein